MKQTKCYGDLLLENKKFKEAIHAYTQATKNNEEKPDVYYNLGIAYSRINEFSLAKECFTKTIEIDSNMYNAYYRLGQISLLYRDVEAAEKYFMQSIYNETEAKSYFQLAKIFIIKNNKTKSGTYINKAIKLNSEYYDIANNEPIFFPIKQLIEKPNETTNEIVKESKEEKEISDYLDDTYNLTKVLDKKKPKDNFKNF